MVSSPRKEVSRSEDTAEDSPEAGPQTYIKTGQCFELKRAPYSDVRIFLEATANDNLMSPPSRVGLQP